MFGSIAGAESVLLGFGADLQTRVAMAEAPHGTAPALEGKDVANPMAMLLSCAAVLHQAAQRGHHDAESASRAVYEAVLKAVGSGCRTPDLGGEASTTEYVDEVIARVRCKRARPAQLSRLCAPTSQTQGVLQVIRRWA